MIKIIIHGCCGRMGKSLKNIINENDDFQIVAGIDKFINDKAPYIVEDSFPIYNDIKKCSNTADVIIDFSNYMAVNCLLEYCIEKNIPAVIATTALQKEQIDLINIASSKIPIFYSPNMSVGINSIVNSINQIVSYLNDFDIEIIEAHHANKADFPSATALMLADVINKSLEGKNKYLYESMKLNEENCLNTINIHSIRGGTISGEHTIIFAGKDEIVEITHRAYSRDVFALGALKAAKFIVNKQNGLYSMKDICDKYI